MPLESFHKIVWGTVPTKTGFAVTAKVIAGSKKTGFVGPEFPTRDEAIQWIMSFMVLGE